MLHLPYSSGHIERQKVGRENGEVYASMLSVLEAHRQYLYIWYC